MEILLTTSYRLGAKVNVQNVEVGDVVLLDGNIHYVQKLDNEFMEDGSVMCKVLYSDSFHGRKVSSKWVSSSQLRHFDWQAYCEDFRGYTDRNRWTMNAIRQFKGGIDD